MKKYSNNKNELALFPNYLFWKQPGSVSYSLTDMVLIFNLAISTKTMNCEDLQLNMPLFTDNDLTVEQKSILEKHFIKCPPCRAKFSEFKALHRDLRSLSQPNMPSDLLFSIRSNVANKLNSAPKKSWFNFSDEWNEWLQFRLMPYGVGTALSLFLAFSFLYSLNSTRESSEKTLGLARNSSNRSFSPPNNNPLYSEEPIIETNEELVAMRTPVSGESPSLNMKGSLLAITNSILNQNLKNNEVTLVANVFSNGLAQITEIVEAPRSRHSLEELSYALENDENYAPFVSADLDKRSNVVRVVFKIQRVDVDVDMLDKPAKKKSLSK